MDIVNSLFSLDTSVLYLIFALPGDCYNKVHEK